MSTVDQSLITAVVNGRNLGEFDTRSGGVTSGEITKHRPGGGGQKSYGGRKRDHDDVSITRTYDKERDIAELAAWLRQQIGKASSVSEQPTDDDDNAWGKPTVYSGKLKSVDTGDVDSNSADRRVMTLMFDITEVS